MDYQPRRQLRPWVIVVLSLVLIFVAVFVSIFVFRPGILFPNGSSSSASSHSNVALPKDHVTIDFSSPVGTSQFSPGISHVDDTLSYPWNNNDQTAVNHAKDLLKQAITYQNTAIMAWGAPDPWPDPSQAEPSDWSYLDQRVQLARDTGGIPVLTLCEAPWWMKGILQQDGTTQLLKASDEWSNDAYNARILDNKMGAWLHLVQRVAERYMAPPYNVRYFQVWNELKGYYNPATQNFDYNNSPGDPSGPNAKHGYTYMYNQVYNRLMQVATSLGIPKGEIKVGGPYVSVITWSASDHANLSHLSKAYGTYDQRLLDAIQYWLHNKVGAGFITIDGSNSNDDKDTVDPFTAAEKFGDMVSWIRSLDNTTYPGAATLPIWWAEWYATTYAHTSNNQYDAAIKAYAMIKLLKAGGAVALSWGGTGDDTTYDGGLWTDTGSAGGGQPRPWYDAYKAFKLYFGPGTKLYRATVSIPNDVEALASSSRLMLVNKTAQTISLAVEGEAVTLSPYQVSVIAIKVSIP
ncbi:MAG TPA: hypothetical protein VFB60_14855 [Ktedonobacteraceae bacterium]|nr:hypothetical protein [Ktedonobacteraceae bacterium]